MTAQFKGDGDFLGPGVAGDDGVGHCRAVVRTKAGEQGGVLRGDAHHRHGQADHASGAHADFAALEAERLGHRITHRGGIVNALHAGAGVGIAGIGDDGADVPLAEMGLGDADRCGLDTVGGERAGGTAGFFGIYQREIEPRLGRVLDATTHRTGEKSLRRAHAAGNA